MTAGRIPQEIVDRAEALGIGDVALRLGAKWKGGAVVDNRGTACPGCGGRDRFSVDRAKNVFFCRMSGAGGGPVALVRHVHGCGFREAVTMLAGDAALPEAPAPAPEKIDRSDEFREKARRRAWAIWQSGRPPLDLVPAYLARRGIALPDWRLSALREIDQLAYWHWSETEKDFRIAHRGSAMLAAITGPDGRFMGVHRTWIDLDRPNGKATIADPETGEILASKKVEGSQRGGAIVLRNGDDGRPALWCAVNKDNLAGKAAESVPHPSRTIRDSLGRERRAKVAGPVPDLSDDRCLAVPAGRFAAAILLGDGDSDAFETGAAMTRAERRFDAAGLASFVDWAPFGKDWNDALIDGEAAPPLAVPENAVVIGEGIETVLSWAQFRAAQHAGDGHDRTGRAGRPLPLHGEMLGSWP